MIKTKRKSTKKGSDDVSCDLDGAWGKKKNVEIDEGGKARVGVKTRKSERGKGRQSLRGRRSSTKHEECK